ncbi:DUF4040 domain-containing protein [Gimibacter soli]|uniref:DUF4040 domain-containing protein n=1 Tax=Gimibacter soli TaxID=3024400 RepID=A0AAE9XNW8_9PROT|nr:DUF4040 domain-containing protein [Gimibacter soli]WCL54503.1 DUF4040 domain-containing protein [Gimibacter soli]
MSLLFSVILVSFLLVVAVAVVRTANLFAAIMLFAIFSLLAASYFFTLDAADVALTEAAVGAGIATVLFLSALALTDDEEKPDPDRRPFLTFLVLALMAAPLLYLGFWQPAFGGAETPVQQHVTPWYLETTPEAIDIPNLVTAVLASFRGYDTLGEVFVIFTAGIGVYSILGMPKRGGAHSARSAAAWLYGIGHHAVPRVVSKILIPFIVLFGLYVQFHGDFGPGGGFQAGAIVASGIILYALIEGGNAARAVLPVQALLRMAVIGCLTYAGVGIATLLMGGDFLDYSVLSADPVAGQHLGILVIELGVGLTVTGILLLIFHAFAQRETH